MWQICPLVEGNFTDSFSDGSYFILTVRAHIGQIRCWQIYPLPKWQFLIYLFWQLILDRPSVGSSTAHRMAISQIPSLTGHISFLIWEVILGRPGVGRSTPSIKQQFHRFLFWRVIFHSYCESSYWADQVLADLPPPKWQFLIFLLWQLILDRPSVGRSTAHRMAISQIPSLTGHISFLIWEVILGRSGVGRSTPSIKQQFYRFLLWQVIFHS